MQSQALHNPVRSPKPGVPSTRRSVVAAMGLAPSAASLADTVVDWGTVVTPLTTEASFSFAQYDLAANFTDSYQFSLEGEAGASYSVPFALDACRNGCGSPELSYGIYDNNGGLLGTVGNTVDPALPPAV